MTVKLRVSNTAIRAALDDVKRAKENLLGAIYAVTSACAHDSVGEAPYQYNDHLANSPPKRVCMHCGLVEEGWSAGYLVLKNELVFKLTRDQVYDLRTVQIDQEDKGPIIRKEVTLNKLLADKLGIK